MTLHFLLVPIRGIEPRLPDYETGVLPLDYTSVVTDMAVMNASYDRHIGQLMSGARPVDRCYTHPHEICDLPRPRTRCGDRTLNLERVSRIELPYRRWQRCALPLSYTRVAAGISF